MSILPTVRPFFHPSVYTTLQLMHNLRLSSYRGSLQPDIAHSCCGSLLLTAVKTGYVLTSITYNHIQAQLLTH